MTRRTAGAGNGQRNVPAIPGTVGDVRSAALIAPAYQRPPGRWCLPVSNIRALKASARRSASGAVSVDRRRLMPGAELVLVDCGVPHRGLYLIIHLGPLMCGPGRDGPCPRAGLDVLGSVRHDLRPRVLALPPLQHGLSGGRGLVWVLFGVVTPPDHGFLFVVEAVSFALAVGNRVTDPVLSHAATLRLEPGRSRGARDPGASHDSSAARRPRTIVT